MSNNPTPVAATPALIAEITSRVDLAANQLALREPFIAAVMTKVRREVSERVPTAGTNGTTVWFNPHFCSPLSDRQLLGLLIHEAMHVVFMHSWRRNGRNPQLWNVANDAVINRMILQTPGRELPAGGVNIDWVTDEMSSEEVYEKLRQEESNGGGKGKGKGNAPDRGAGGFDGTGDLEDALDDATSADMEATIRATAEMAKAAGQGSALIDRVLGSTGKSAVPWYSVVRDMATEKTAADYTYMRPSRRHIASGLYLPSLHSEGLGGLLIGFDTSGSMGQKECDQVAAELQAIVDDVSPAFVEVVYCDASVTSVQRFDRDEPLELRPKGGGGTRFQPVFEHAAKTGENYCGMVFFTDMEGNLAECVRPEYPVVWADIGRSHPEPPFGVRVEVIF
jgi:predicted metal-dependent peptidase